MRYLFFPILRPGLQGVGLLPGVLLEAAGLHLGCVNGFPKLPGFFHPGLLLCLPHHGLRLLPGLGYHLLRLLPGLFLSASGGFLCRQHGFHRGLRHPSHHLWSLDFRFYFLRR